MKKLSRAEKLRETGIKKFGSEEKWREWLRESGRKASRETPRGFATMKDKQRHLELSSKGGFAKAERFKNGTTRQQEAEVRENETN